MLNAHAHAEKNDRRNTSKTIAQKFSTYLVPGRTLIQIKSTLCILLKETPGSIKWPERSIISRFLRKWNNSDIFIYHYKNYKNQGSLSLQKKYQVTRH